jgi:hypothetical protein
MRKETREISFIIVVKFPRYVLSATRVLNREKNSARVEFYRYGYC